MKHKHLLPVVALLLGLACPPLFAAQELRAVLFDVVPFSYRNDAGQIVGLHVDKIKELAARAGYPAHIELTSFARIALLLEHGGADLTIGFETAPLMRAADRLGPIMYGSSILLSRQPLTGPLPGVLQGLRLGRLRGGCFELQRYRPQLQVLHELNNYSSGLNMLNSERLDAVCGTDAGLAYAVEQAGLNPADYHSLVLTRDRAFWVFLSRRASPAVRQAVEQAVGEMAVPQR
ncbi:hypothetical protein A9179_04940 [Pseudomonas alcaligenes]|uniref:Solute-binding protein family 3/N-terminal domain-containing protein n=1 Tax=Aquipseudomonas alcaligenes TaxID=43263 RepID=A0ABR7RYJ8_AQUAC|nr:transporter substrate-binding domain-containing protein [Pseudomonas alcaligenes]MBC9249615.1 hypothetical protein [Pseudomonas alcaligenes]